MKSYKHFTPSERECLYPFAKKYYSITQIAKEPGVTAMNTAIIRHLMLICFILTEEKNVSESKKMSAEATERALSA